MAGTDTAARVAEVLQNTLAKLSTHRCITTAATFHNTTVTVLFSSTEEAPSWESFGPSSSAIDSFRPDIRSLLARIPRKVCFHSHKFQKKFWLLGGGSVSEKFGLPREYDKSYRIPLSVVTPDLSYKLRREQERREEGGRDCERVPVVRVCEL